MSASQENHPVREVIQAILAEAKINDSQVQQLEKFVDEDWVIDEAEVTTLFEINKSVGDEDKNCPRWTDFFVRSISRLVVMDMNSPGEIDQQEGDFIGGLMEQFSVDNDSEQKLMFQLQNTCSKIEGKLGEKYQPFK